jgi:hypothetical protein
MRGAPYSHDRQTGNGATNMSKLLSMIALIAGGSWVGVEAYVVIADAVESIGPLLVMPTF